MLQYCSQSGEVTFRNDYVRAVLKIASAPLTPLTLSFPAERGDGSSFNFLLAVRPSR